MELKEILGESAWESKIGELNLWWGRRRRRDHAGNREIEEGDSGSFSWTQWNFHWRLGHGDWERERDDFDVGKRTWTRIWGGAVNLQNEDLWQSFGVGESLGAPCKQWPTRMIPHLETDNVSENLGRYTNMRRYLDFEGRYFNLTRWRKICSETLNFRITFERIQLGKLNWHVHPVNSGD